MNTFAERRRQQRVAASVARIDEQLARLCCLDDLDGRCAADVLADALARMIMDAFEEFSTPR